MHEYEDIPGAAIAAFHAVPGEPEHTHHHALVRFWRATLPTMVLLRDPDTQRRRHGNYLQTVRHWRLYLGGVLLETWEDDSARTQYASEKDMDYFILEYVSRLETALGVRCLRARARPAAEVRGSRSRKAAARVAEAQSASSLDLLRSI